MRTITTTSDLVVDEMAVQDTRVLRMKRRIPEEVRTVERDAAAMFIKEDIIKEGRWPMKLVDMEKECKWTRQHLSKVIDHYFEEVDESELEDENDRELDRLPGATRQLDIPDDVDQESYLRGYVKRVAEEKSSGQTTLAAGR